MPRKTIYRIQPIDNYPTQSAYLCIFGKIGSSFRIFNEEFSHIRHDRPLIWLVHVHICANKYEMYYRSGTDGRCYIGAEQTLREHSPGGSIFLHEVIDWLIAWPASWIMASNSKSDSVRQCVFTWRTILPNFIPIRFETTEPFWQQEEKEQQ